MSDAQRAFGSFARRFYADKSCIYLEPLRLEGSRSGRYSRTARLGRYTHRMFRMMTSMPMLHVVERFTRTDPGTILYEATIEDPVMYTKPWKVQGRRQRG